MILRDYKSEDAREIIKWIHSERELKLWSADRYNKYPITPDDINDFYSFAKSQSLFCPLILEDNGKVIGHIILRKKDPNKNIIRLGFVIVDSTIRGKGYGRKLLEESIKYAKEKYNPEKLSIGVFTINTSAYKCYENVGFKTVEVLKDAFHFYNESWDCAEMILE